MSTPAYPRVIAPAYPRVIASAYPGVMIATAYPLVLAPAYPGVLALAYPGVVTPAYPGVVAPASVVMACQRHYPIPVQACSCILTTSPVGFPPTGYSWGLTLVKPRVYPVGYSLGFAWGSSLP